MSKPVAYYTAALFDPYVGTSARVLSVNHPILGNEKNVTTSKVLRVFEDGFETLNTIYLKMKQAY